MVLLELYVNPSTGNVDRKETVLLETYNRNYP